MSFSSILDKIGGLLSKSFLLSALLPTIVFILVNGYMAYFNDPWLHRYIAQKLVAPTGMMATVLGLFLLIFAYAVSGMSLILTDLLEGKHMPRFPKGLMVKGHRKKREALRERRQLAQNNSIAIQSKRQSWIDRQEAATDEAFAQAKQTHDFKLYYSTPRAVQVVMKKVSEDDPATAQELEEAVRAFTEAVKTPGLELDDPSLGGDWDFLLRDFDLTYKAWYAIEVDMKTQLQTRYGAAHLAPTAFGNVAESVESYALIRYEFDFNIFWTSLQTVIQTANPNLYSSLDDTKSQVDFFVSLWWLWTPTWIFWSIFSLMKNQPILGGAEISMGLAGSYTVYFLATRNYAVMASFIRSAIDLYRLSLLKSMQIPMPKGLSQERATWRTLQRGVGFGAEVEISYLDSKG